jgi:hypothetical protein
MSSGQPYTHLMAFGADRGNDLRSGSCWAIDVRALLVALVVIVSAWSWAGSFRGRPERSPSSRNAPALIVDPNTVPAQVFTALPHVGPALARGLDAARRERPLESLRDARQRVSGLGPASIKQMAPYLRLAEASSADEPGPRAVISANQLRTPSKTASKPSRTKKARREPAIDRGLASVAVATNTRVATARHDDYSH